VNHTSSKYKPNKLEEVIINNTQHFVARSYFSPIFESEHTRSEYHLYWYNRNKKIDDDLMRYRCLSSKKMNKKEVRTFFEKRDLYFVDLSNKYGDIYVNKKIGFYKGLVKFTRQLNLF
jgi:hypothetical protein